MRRRAFLRAGFGSLVGTAVAPPPTRTTSGSTASPRPRPSRVRPTAGSTTDGPRRRTSRDWYRTTSRTLSRPSSGATPAGARLPVTTATSKWPNRRRATSSALLVWPTTLTPAASRSTTSPTRPRPNSSPSTTQTPASTTTTSTATSPTSPSSSPAKRRSASRGWPSLTSATRPNRRRSPSGT